MKRKALTLATMMLALGGTALAPAAQAHPGPGPYHGGPYHGPRWHATYHYHYEPARWRAGHWVQTWHGGRYGWWWLVGTTWLLYPTPVYPYPDPVAEPVYMIDDTVTTTPAPAAPAPPPPAASASPAPGQAWYYCDAAKGYYPYVPTCPSGWQTVPATPPDRN